MEPLSSKLRGLWVGLALGELYGVGQGLMRGNALLTKTRQLYLRVEGWLQASEPEIQSFLLEEIRSPDLCLEVLPLVFLHPTGIPGLQKQLQHGLDQICDRKMIMNAIAVVETLAKLMSENLMSENLLSSSDLAPEMLPFLKTLDDFRLTVQRTQAMGHPPEMIMLGAALSGFKTGLRGLPFSWRLNLRTLQWTEGHSCEDELCGLADRCLAQWAGCYETERSNGLAGVAIAHPSKKSSHNK